MCKDQNKSPPAPSTKSQINLDSMFHSNFELSATVVHHIPNAPRIISGVEFCESTEGQTIFRDIAHNATSSPLETVLQLLECKLSRTDNALNYHKASRLDYFPDASKAGGYEEVYARREHVIWAAFTRACKQQHVGLLIYAPNQAVMSSFLKASEIMEFHVPAEMAGWDLQEALERSLPYETLKRSRTIPVGELYDSPLVFFTPLIEMQPIMRNLDQCECSYKGDVTLSTEGKHAPMAQITVIKRHAQKHLNGGTGETGANHIIELLTPTGLWMNDTTAESIARACTPVFPYQDSKEIFEESISGNLLRYDFDYCVPYVMERSLYTRETLYKEHVHSKESIHKITNMEVTPGNKEFTHMMVKGRRCHLITMAAPTGLVVENGLSLVKLSNMGRKLARALSNHDKLAQGQVRYK